MPHPFKGKLGRGFSLRVLACSNAFRSWFTHIRCYQLRCQGKLTTKGCFNPFGLTLTPTPRGQFFSFVNEIVLNLFYFSSGHLLHHCLYFVHTRQWNSTWRQKCRNPFVLYLDSRLPWIATDITPATSRMLCSWVGYMALWYPRGRGHGQWGLNSPIVLIHLHENCNWCRGTTVRNKIGKVLPCVLQLNFVKMLIEHVKYVLTCKSHRVVF